MDLFNRIMDFQKISSTREPTYVPTYLTAYLPTYLPASLPWARLTCQPAVAREHFYVLTLLSIGMKAKDRFLYIDFAEYRHEGKGTFF